LKKAIGGGASAFGKKWSNASRNGDETDKKIKKFLIAINDTLEESKFPGKNMTLMWNIILKLLFYEKIKFCRISKNFR
jgi:hypothetical protein